MLNVFCLALMTQLQAEPVFIPEHVDRLVKSRLLQQLQLQHPEIQAQFGESTCTEKSVYFYTGEALIILPSNTGQWPTRAEFNLTEILDGRKLNFPTLIKPERGAPLSDSTATHNATSAQTVAEVTSPTRKWMPWVVGALGLVAGVTWLAKRGNNPNPPSGAPLRLKNF